MSKKPDKPFKWVVVMANRKTGFLFIPVVKAFDSNEAVEKACDKCIEIRIDLGVDTRKKLLELIDYVCVNGPYRSPHGRNN